MYREQIKQVCSKHTQTTTADMIPVIRELQALGLFSEDLMLTLNGNQIDITSQQPGYPPSISTPNELVNWIKAEADRLNVPTKCEELLNMQNNILVGTEFTFSKDKYLFSIEDLDKKSHNADAEGYIAEAKSIIQEQVNKILKNTNKRHFGSTTLYSRDLTNPASKKDGQNHNIAKIEITFVPDKEDSFTWWLNFDLDSNCIEIQAQPMSYVFYRKYADLIQELLFSFDNDWRPDPNPQTGGGGHISLDYRTAFKDTPYYLLNFIVLYNARIAAGLRLPPADRDCLQICQDVDNAPILSEVGELGSFISTIQPYHQTPNRAIVLQPFVANMNGNVYQNATDKMILILQELAKNKSEIPQLIPHYQAVNLEHLTINTPELEKRVELRRFDAQLGVGQLLNQLDAIYDLLQESRTFKPLTLAQNMESVMEGWIFQ